MKTIKFVGGMPSGILVDPFTQQTWTFEKDQPISVPDATADRVIAQQPAENPDWVVA